MQDYMETEELNTIAPEKPPSPDYPPEVYSTSLYFDEDFF